LKVGVAGSEIVGLVPLEAILMAAEYYIRKEDLFVIEEDRKIRLAVERLGLNAVAPFNPREKIIEYIVAESPDEPLAGSPLRTFIENIAARTSTPGGGSASAAMAAFGTALGEMASQLTYGVRKFESVDAQMRAIIPVLHDATQNLIPQIDADTSAFNEYMQGLRMPKETPSEEAARRAKMQSGLKTAIDVPLKTMRLADAAWDALCDTARYANPAAKSDLQVAARALETGIWGAYQNVCINMTGIEDRRFESEILATAEKIADRAVRKCAEVLKILDKRSTVQPE
jgi:glutamate formiminotransferase/formiminotetrahydrofolate cyclodeaminase